MNVFCTIITADHLPYAVTLYRSLIAFDTEVKLEVLIVDGDEKENKLQVNYPGIHFHDIENLSAYPLVAAVYHKYAHTEMDAFRWAVKPLFISYLLETMGGKLIYVDSDIFFYRDFRFLFDELDDASVLLTPHWRNTDPVKDEQSFYAVFTGGIFNAGFIGVTKAALPAMKWWAEVCHYKMGAHPHLGIHDDQRYLDVLPVEFDHVKVVRHRGCNVGAWNATTCRRELVNGQVLINGVYPVIFMHFNKQFIKEILKGHNPLLRPYFDQFKTIFEQDGTLLSEFIPDIDYYLKPGLLMKLKWKLKLRTRLKSFLFKLAERL